MYGQLKCCARGKYYNINGHLPLWKIRFILIKRLIGYIIGTSIEVTVTLKVW
jgi:hypothetical protein